MSETNEESLHRQLKSEGFRRTYAWEDGPNTFYPEHTHTTETAHIVLHGELALTMNGVTRVYRAGSVATFPVEQHTPPAWDLWVAAISSASADFLYV